MRRRSWILCGLLLAGVSCACGGPPDAVTVAAGAPEHIPPPEVVPAVADEDHVKPAPSASATIEADEQTPSSGHADLDPTNDNVVGPPDPLADCEQRLEAAGVRFKPARIGVGRKRGGVYTCGAKQVVRFRRGPGDIRYGRSPLVTCTMALALADFERIVQEEAERMFQSRVARIDHLGTYNCREMANFDLISEHSFANAIDLRRFHLENGEAIGVLEDFLPKESSPTDPKTLFLRTLTNRLFDEEVFSVVVTPFFDRIHRNHIHIDLARYRVDGSRP